MDQGLALLQLTAKKTNTDVFASISGSLDDSVMFAHSFRSAKASSEDPEDNVLSSSTENDDEGASRRHQVWLPVALRLS